VKELGVTHKTDLSGIYNLERKRSQPSSFKLEKRMFSKQVNASQITTEKSKSETLQEQCSHTVEHGNILTGTYKAERYTCTTYWSISGSTHIVKRFCNIFFHSRFLRRNFILVLIITDTRECEKGFSSFSA
jgi:hypothetical protein